jgi:very-short-patch-repair endonuclease
LFDEKSLEALVREKLQKIGYQVDLKVGYSDYKIDLAVVHPDNPSKYILAIETDGESFTSANSTIERDIIRQDFLESRGWRVERIWSRNWWRNSDEEMRRIQQKIEEIRHSDNSIANEKSNNTTSQSTIREILSTEQKFEESSSSITPQTPFSNKVRYRKALESCEGYIHWIDKWFSAYGLEILSDCNIKNINEIKILTSDLRVDTKLRDTIIDFSKEFKNRGIVCEMKFLITEKFIELFMIDGYYPKTYVSTYRLQILWRGANIAKLNKPLPGLLLSNGGSILLTSLQTGMKSQG